MGILLVICINNREDLALYLVRRLTFAIIADALDYRYLIVFGKHTIARVDALLKAFLLCFESVGSCGRRTSLLDAMHTLLLIVECEDDEMIWRKVTLTSK